MEKLVCDRCGQTYTDRESIEFAKRGKGDWEAMVRANRDEPRGICPCPIIPCPGEMILVTEGEK